MRRLGGGEGWPTGSHCVTSGVADSQGESVHPAIRVPEPAYDGDHAGNQRGSDDSWQKLLEKEHLGALLFDALQAYDHVDLVTDRSLHEGHAMVAALDREARFAASANFPLHPFALASLLDFERERLCYPVQGEVARDFISIAASVDLRALKGHYGKLFGVEEIRALNVLVAFCVVGVHTLDGDLQVHGVLGRVGFVESDCARHIVEAAIKVADS